MSLLVVAFRHPLPSGRQNRQFIIGKKEEVKISVEQVASPDAPKKERVAAGDAKLFTAPWCCCHPPPRRAAWGAARPNRQHDQRRWLLLATSHHPSSDIEQSMHGKLGRRKKRNRKQGNKDCDQ